MGFSHQFSIKNEDVPDRYRVREIAQQVGLSEATVARALLQRLAGRKYLVDVFMQAPHGCRMHSTGDGGRAAGAGPCGGPLPLPAKPGRCRRWWKPWTRSEPAGRTG